MVSEVGENARDTQQTATQTHSPLSHGVYNKEEREHEVFLVAMVFEDVN